MTAPSIEMIAESLRNCSIGRRNKARPRSSWAPPPPPPPSSPPPEEEENEVTVDLNSDIALPYYWEQCLDMRTGEIYYVNWKTGTRTTNDPRNPKTCSPAISFYSSSVAADEYEEEDTCDTECSSGITSLSSSSSSNSDATSPASTVLVAAGCKACFMYFMVPKLFPTCPNCGGELLQLGRGDDEEDDEEECF